MISRTLLIICLAGMPASVMGVDLTAMEAMIEALEQPAGEKAADAARCNYALAEQTGRELPSDFDFCQPERQPSLINNGLYVNTEGVIKPLPVRRLSPQQVTKVTVPLPVKDDVLLKPHTPFVIDLALPASKPSSNDHSKPRTKPTTQPIQSAAVAPKTSTRQQRSQPVFGCPGFQTFAHRGSSEEAENSIEAVSKALQSGHNGVEIDVQQLKDGNWVVHHDLSLGRVNYGQSGLVTNMTSHQWRKVRLKDVEGFETGIHAPFLVELLIAYRRSAAASQVLNI
ncbi:MAG: glycerophosphodiester phosphodiesterase family protein [Pseudomonas sp.]|nr:glycerophosphodiester phosphodiesterase family protein [Pseudomonas sp.]